MPRLSVGSASPESGLGQSHRGWSENVNAFTFAALGATIERRKRLASRAELPRAHIHDQLVGGRWWLSQIDAMSVDDLIGQPPIEGMVGGQELAQLVLGILALQIDDREIALGRSLEECSLPRDAAALH